MVSHQLGVLFVFSLLLGFLRFTRNISVHQSVCGFCPVVLRTPGRGLKRPFFIMGWLIVMFTMGIAHMGTLDQGVDGHV